MIKYNNISNALSLVSCCIGTKINQLIKSIEIGSCKDSIKEDLVKLNVAYHILNKVSFKEQCNECVLLENMCYSSSVIQQQINIINKLCKNCKENG